MIEYTTETGGTTKIFAIANGKVIWNSRQDLFLYTTEEVCHADWKSRNRIPIPKGTRIKVYDIMRNFYGLWVETYYEGRYYSIDPRCLEYKKRVQGDLIMTKCIGRMPECQYFTTGGGCASPVNCLYKVEGIYSNSATSNTTCYVVYDKYLKQAEKELAEERKDEQS